MEPAFTLLITFNALLISLVMTPAASPYVVSFARLITSSTVLNFSMLCTGPKI